MDSTHELVPKYPPVMDLIQSLRGYSNGEVNRAGAYLAAGTPGTQGFQQALEIVSNWRTLHQGPLTLLRTMLEDEISDRGFDALVVGRLKRIPTIQYKLRREPQMRLAAMQDIGGVRAVVNTVAEARALAVQLDDLSPYFTLKLPFRDYISNPNVRSGYRGLHLVFSFQSASDEFQKLSGLKIELQIRTRLQHIWATAVETVGTFTGQPLKFGEGNPDWLEFFRLAGALFAELETKEEPACPELVSLREKLDVFDRLSAYSVAQEVIKAPEAAGRLTDQHGRPWQETGRYAVLVLNLQELSIHAAVYSADQFAEAVERQQSEEARHMGNSRVDTVMVSVDSLGNLRDGYPNYFADTGDFINLVYGHRPREANYGVWAGLREDE